MVCSSSLSVLLGSAALLTQEALELLRELFTADRPFAPCGRTWWLLGGTTGLTLQFPYMGSNLRVFGNGLRHPGVKIAGLFSFREKGRQANNLHTTAHQGENALGIRPWRHNTACWPRCWPK